MAGMLRGAGAARRRRFHKNYSSGRPSFCLYPTSYEFMKNSSLQRERPIKHDKLYDERGLDAAAREAKKRLDERLKSQTRSPKSKKQHSGGDQCVKNKAGTGSVKWEGNGSKRLSWLRLGRRTSEEEECAVCLEAFKSRRGGTLMQLGCGHRFHTGCLLPWLEGNAHCPCCRRTTDRFLKI